MAARVQEWEAVRDAVTNRLPLPGGMHLELGDRTLIADLAALVEAHYDLLPVLLLPHGRRPTRPRPGSHRPDRRPGPLATVFGDHA